MAIFSRARLCAAVSALLTVGVFSIDASSPRFFQAATQGDFLLGDLDNLSLDSRGRLVLGPATELLFEAPSPFLWSVVAAPDGSLFIGTGNDGRVYRVDPQGNGAPFFDATELEVHAMAPAPNGGLYVGTSPEGKIYRVDRGGVATVLADPDDRYIWALATDARGNLYAATGERGIVYRIAADGVSTPFYQTKAGHATALVFDRSGDLFVGTSSPARVLRVGPDGRGFLLLDTPFEEIRSLRLDNKGMLYVAAVNSRSSAGGSTTIPVDSSSPAPAADPGRPPVPSVSVSTEITAVVVDTPGSSTPTRDDRRTTKGAVYRIAPDGLWDELWASREDAPYDVNIDESGRIIIGTGSQGRILRLEGEPLRPVLVARAGAQQVTSLYRDGRGRVYYATANPGKLYRLAAGRAERGTYESDVRDARMVSSWGSISWRGTIGTGQRIEISTRSGNTATPDDTWSPWSAPYGVPEGTPITSPKARYLQWRALLSGPGDGPALSSISAAYLPRNLPPQVRTITVHPAGIVFQKPYGTGDPDLAGFENQSTPDRKLAQAAQNSAAGASPSLGRRTYQKGLQTFVWQADDANDDDLSFELWYRREGDATWKPIQTDITAPIFVWDTTTVPNGTYLLRVVASDAPSNAGGSALAGELESAIFDIDNSPPAIVTAVPRVEGARTRLAFDVTDDHSPVLRVEVSLDGHLWKSAFPADGIADSRSEHFEITLDEPIGARGLTLRATDAMNNVATAHVSPPAGR